MQNPIILSTRNLTKQFKGFVAVRDVNLEVERGTIHAIIGPNGAGKTTCFNLLTKFLTPTAGEIFFNGHDIGKMSPADVARLRLVRSFQISAVFPRLSVLENVRIARQRKRGNSFDFWRSRSVLQALDADSLRLLETVGLLPYAALLAAELSYGQKRALEIATTLALDPEMLLLDEPTSGMTLEDIERLATLIRTIATRCTILMVEHNMSFVSLLSDRITVMARGQILSEGDYKAVSTDAAVIEAYMGTIDV